MGCLVWAVRYSDKREMSTRCRINFDAYYFARSGNRIAGEKVERFIRIDKNLFASMKRSVIRIDLEMFNNKKEQSDLLI